MASLAKAAQDLAALKSTVETLSALLIQLQTTSALESETTETANTVDALSLAYDAASLIKAHSTKLSLLIINKPFTATAITTVLRELVSGPLPGLASAVELCAAGKYTKVMRSEIEWRARKVFTELGTLVAAIPLDGKILSDDQKKGTGAVKGKGSLANTGVVWKACDEVMALKSLGVVGLVIRKADEYQALLKDALEELQEWDDEESDEEEDDEGDSGDESKELSAQEVVDNIFGSQQHIPADDPEKIKPRFETTQKRLRLLILMFQAVVKRRFKTLPQFPLTEPQVLKEKSGEKLGIVSCLDEVLDVLKAIPDITDELASAFYDLDATEIDRRMNQCFSEGSIAAGLLITNWDGQKDEFSTWVSPVMPQLCYLLTKPGSQVPDSYEERMVNAMNIFPCHLFLWLLTLNLVKS